MPKFLDVSNPAAARAALGAPSAADVSEEITAAVVEAVAADETVVAAAATAVSDAVDGLNLVEADDARLPEQVHFHDNVDIGGGFVDSNYLSTDLVVRATDGQVPDYVIDRWAERMIDNGQVVSPDVVEQIPSVHDGVLVALTDSTDQRTWLEASDVDGGPTDWSMRLLGERIIFPESGPLGDLVPLTPVREERIEGEGFNAGETKTIANISGAGTVRSIWLALDAAGAARDWRILRDTRLQIFVDGEGSPSVDVDCAGVFLASGNAIWAGFDSWTDHMSAGCAGAWPAQTYLTATFQFPIPYASGCIIRLYNPGSTTATVFAQTRYVPNKTSKHRLKSICLPVGSMAYATKDDTPTLLQTPGTSSGWLVWFSMTGEGYSATVADRATWLERNLAYYVDGEANPSILSTGYEDVFVVGWYYSSMEPNGSHPWMSLSNSTNTTAVTGVGVSAVTSGVDHLKLSGGIPFTESLRLQLQTEARTKVGHDYGFAALFYAYEGDWADPDTAAAAPSAPLNPRAFPYANNKVLVTWDLPVRSGSSPITGYTVTPSAGSAVTVGAGARSAVITASSAITCTVVATNSAGNSASSAATSSVAPPTLASDPTTVTGLTGWWRADEYTGSTNPRPIARLTDFTGNRNDGTNPIITSRPIISATPLNSLPILTTNPQAFLRLTHSIPNGTDMTVFCVVRTPATISNSRTVLGDAPIGGTADGLLVNAAGKLVGKFGGAEVGVHTIAPNTAYVVSASSGASGNVWLNGVAGTPGAAGSTHPGSLWMNKTTFATANGANFDFAEVLVFTDVLSAGNRQTVEAYLATKYGITL